MNQKNNPSGKRSKIVLILFVFVLVFLGCLVVKLLKGHATPEPISPMAAQQEAIQQAALVKVVEQAKLPNNDQKKSEDLTDKNKEAQEKLNTLYNSRSNALSLAKVDTALLTEQATQQKLKAEIAQSESQMGMLIHPYMNSTTKPISGTSLGHALEPSITWIATRDNKAIASIRQSNGVFTIVHEGMSLPDGAQVQVIDNDSVTLVKDGKIQKLILSADYYE